MVMPLSDLELLLSVVLGVLGLMVVVLLKRRTSCLAIVWMRKSMRYWMPLSVCWVAPALAMEQTPVLVQTNHGDSNSPVLRTID